MALNKRSRGALLTAGGAAALLIFVGLEVWFALAWGVAVGALIAITGVNTDDYTSTWPPEPSEKRQPGSSISGLTWGFNPSNSESGPMVMSRIRRLAERRLAFHGLDLDNADQYPSIDSLLGKGAAEQLNARRLSSDKTRALMTALERLATKPEVSRRFNEPNEQESND